MVIEFICPNGHQLTAPDDRAGKPGKCPKCDTSFLVPDPNEPDEEDGVEGHANREPDDDIIVFLCPQGHRLNGPASLKGKAGQCPHCGSKFRIPDDDDEDTYDQVEEAETAQRFRSDPNRSSAEMEEIPDVMEVMDEGSSNSMATDIQPPALPSSFTINGESSFPEIFAWLWQQRESQASLEIHLNSGEVFTPRLFSPELSRSTHAVFASQDEFGKYSVTTIAWDTIARIGLRNLGSVPKDLFR